MPDVKGIPLDAPLYHGGKNRGGAFLGCQAINLMFSVGHEANCLLPKELVVHHSDYDSLAVAG
ncbi:hypothetical protein [Bradyrhizobium sp. LCT2]|uniref:hypothetical protein n=1 Tax=Bradyrhizobium sp. LCT2 TaxID=2493093 RepID=UPI00192A3500|nr:hypothetical protein [Bradyrhizobium sp. LCT2]